MDKNYTLYSAKYTRVIHLKLDGSKDSDIMSLTRHKTYDAYSMYMRDLGLTKDINAINLKTRQV